MVYHLPDQVFPFQKQVQFRDRLQQPDLELDTAGLGIPPTSHLPPYSSMPFCRSSQVPLNCTFNVSGILVTNVGNAQDAATIVAEVLAAAAAQALKELCGRYTADVELIFWSWRVDVLVNIQD